MAYVSTKYVESCRVLLLSLLCKPWPCAVVNSLHWSQVYATALILGRLWRNRFHDGHVVFVLWNHLAHAATAEKLYKLQAQHPHTVSWTADVLPDFVELEWITRDTEASKTCCILLVDEYTPAREVYEAAQERIHKAKLVLVVRVSEEFKTRRVRAVMDALYI